MAQRFDYESETDEFRVLKLALVLWKDAFSDFDTVKIDTISKQLRKGMPMFTAGILTHDDGDTVVVAQDMIAPYGMMRDVRSIPKVNIINIWITDVKWDEQVETIQDVLADTNPNVFATDTMKLYTGWRGDAIVPVKRPAVSSVRPNSKRKRSR